MSKADVVDVLCTYMPERIVLGATKDEVGDIADVLGVTPSLVLEAIDEACLWLMNDEVVR